MAVTNRATAINKLNKVIRKHYKPVKGTTFSVIDTILYACCLENSHFDAAQLAFDQLKTVTFDLNELRVTTISELAELMPKLPYPKRAASNVKKVLQSIFESQYSYDLEPLRKQNLGKAVQIITKYEGASPFIVGYVTQHALGGHSIPIDRGTLECLYIAGVIDENEKEKWVVPGLERAIPKNKGVEFASLLHQLGADLVASPYNTKIRNILLEINPDGKALLPKRISKKKKEEAKAEKERLAKEEAEAKRRSEEERLTIKKSPSKAAGKGKKAAKKKSVTIKKSAAKAPAEKPKATKKTATKAAKKPTKKVAKKTTKKKATKKAAKTATKKVKKKPTATKKKKISRRKPR